MQSVLYTSQQVPQKHSAFVFGRSNPYGSIMDGITIRDPEPLTGICSHILEYSVPGKAGLRQVLYLKVVLW